MSNNSISTLPAPSPEEQQLSDELKQTIIQEINKSGGTISFQRFMEITLYAPGLGYYVNGRRILGEHGDFTTGPELSPLFAQCLAKQYIELISQSSGEHQVLEFGGGSGALAAEFLAYLEIQGRLPEQYLILDVSPYLQALQKETLEHRVPHLVDKVRWISSVPNGFRGLILANEVLDAMPVNRVRISGDGQHCEIVVGYKDGELVEQEQPITDDDLASEIQRLCSEVGPLPDGYTTEINTFSRGWLNTLFEQMAEGVIILIDYGYPRSQWYIPDRSAGTLMCHYRHRAHSNPLILLGLQDLTAHVDFTTVAEQAHAAGFRIDGYTNQSFFLTGAGIESLLQSLNDADLATFLSTTGPIKKLLLPQEMGEIFKIMALGKGQEITLSGFGLNDLRAQL